MKTILLALAIISSIFVSSNKIKYFTKPEIFALSTSYYISPSGNDTNDGKSPQTAWSTISRVNQASFQPGDSIFFEGGYSYLGKIYLDFTTDSSTTTNPITISSYGSGRATITSSSEALYVYNLGGIKISNINFTGYGTTNTSSGVIFYNESSNNSTLLSGIVVEDSEISYFKNIGLSIGSYGGTNGYSDVLINRVIAHHNSDGISVYAPSRAIHKNVRVSNSLAYANTGIAGQSKPTGNGIVLGGVDGGTIEYSIAYDNGALNTNPGGPVGIWTYDSNNITLQFNESYNNKTNSALGGGDGGGFDFDGGVSNSIMQYNYSHNNQGAGYLIGTYPGSSPNDNNTVRYNISENDGNYKNYAGITIYGAVNNAKIYQNTIYQKNNTTNPAVFVLNYLASFSNIQLLNNIFVTASGSPIISTDTGLNLTGFMFSGNNYFSYSYPFKISWNGTAYSSLSAWRSAGQETGTGLSLDPLFQNPSTQQSVGYKLSSNSSMINAGLYLPSKNISPGSQDYFGTTIPQNNNFDIGAYEHLFTISPTPIVPTSTPVPQLTSTPTLTLTPTLAPTLTLTPIPTVSSGLQTTLVVYGTAVNEDGSTFTANSSSFWIGTGSKTSYTGIRFPGITIPKNSKVVSAKIEGSPTANSWLTLTYTMYVENSDNSMAFSSSSRPSGRKFSSQYLNFSDNSNWLVGKYYDLGTPVPALQIVINRTNWKSGNAISFIAKGQSPWSRKYMVNTKTFAPRLTITYTNP